MSWVELAAVATVTVLGSIVHGSTGIGIGLVAGPTLLTVDPRFVPGPLLLSSLIVGARHLVVERDQMNRAILTRLLLGVPPGMAAVLIVLAIVDDRVMALTIGVMVVMAAVALLAGVRLPRTPGFEVLGGAASAFGSMAAALPGPPLVMTLHDLPGPVMRPTVAAIVNIIGLVVAISLAALGRFGLAELSLLALLVPFVLAGLYLARFVRPWLDSVFFRPAVLCLSLASGLALVAGNL